MTFRADLLAKVSRSTSKRPFFELQPLISVILRLEYEVSRLGPGNEGLLRQL